ncbi:MAG: methyltransferase domain-containing protein [Candidatus Heimdallarchaeota archaeon]|nr:methyltransferase domain-containing protein [Candidatus Heimdallarchaeota archaeon]
MFGSKSLLEKWSEPFLGLNLHFMEIEILRCIHYYKLTEISEIYDFISNRYPNVSLSKSQFYRIIENLEKGKGDGAPYLVSSRDKKKNTKQLSCSQRGEKELYFFVQYILSFLRDQIFTDEALREMLHLLTPNLGCLRKFKILSISPTPLNLPLLLDMCKSCDHPFNIGDEGIQKPIIISLPGADKELIEIDRDKIQIIESETPYDLLPKDESIDLIFNTLSLYRYNTEDTLKELYRMLKPNGHIFLFEPTDNLPNLVIHIFNEMIKTRTVSQSVWKIDPVENPLFSINELSELLGTHGFDNITHRSELAMTLFIARKK